MKRPETLDAIDQGILKILSLYQDLSLSELWFEIGEAGILEPATKQEVLNRLESLVVQGFVERITLGTGEIRWAYKRSQQRLNKIIKEIGNTERSRKMKKKSSEKAKPKTKNVRFNLHAPEAERVFLAGDFNNWDVHTLAMKKDSKGTWGVSVALPPGRYEYRFRIDEVWHDDPNALDRVENPFGSQNCVRIVS